MINNLPVDILNTLSQLIKYIEKSTKVSQYKHVYFGCTPSWEFCHAYFLYIMYCSIVVILVYLHSKNWINISLFELVVTCIETHIFVPSFLISHTFISVIIFFCCFSLLLEQIFTLNVLNSKTCIQHNIYTIFEEISSFSLFIFIHTRLQRVTLTTRKIV